jgi:predicted transcriptional regulator
LARWAVSWRFGDSGLRSGRSVIAAVGQQMEFNRMGHSGANMRDRQLRSLGGLTRGPALSNELPLAVQLLAPREREVAMLVYRKGALTAKEVGAHLSAVVSNGAIRTMLGRLVRKGVLKRRHSGYGKTFLYLPALKSSDTVEIALQRIAEDFYDGSLMDAASAFTEFFAARPELRSRAA